MRSGRLIIGVTGSFGTGKSTVAGFFKKQGACVFDADKIAHEALLRKSTVHGPRSTCYKKIVKIFGKEILKKNKEIDRKKLAKVVFRNKKLLNTLNSIVHPYVIKRIKDGVKRQRRLKSQTVVVLDVPLLIEAGLQGLVDKVIVVKAGLRQQIERCRKSYGFSRGKVLERINAQMPIKEKIRFADFVIDNSKGKERTRGEVKKIWERIRPQTIQKKRI